MSEEPEEFLSEEESEDFRNYLVIGRVSDTVDVLGHKIMLRTLSVEEDLAVGLIIKPYLGSNSYERAYKTAIVGAALRRIDNEMMPEATSPDDEVFDLVKLKFDKVKKYYPIFLDAVYKEFINLEKKLTPLVSRLGKTSD